MKLHPLSTVLARARRTVAFYGSQEAAARALGVSPSGLNHALTGQRDPGPKLVAALGYRREVRYVDTHDTTPTPTEE